MNLYYYTVFTSTIETVLPIPEAARSKTTRLLGFRVRIPPGTSLLIVVLCQVEVSASGWSLIQRSPTECGVSECDREASIMRRPCPTRGWCAMGGKNRNCATRFHYEHNRYTNQTTLIQCNTTQGMNSTVMCRIKPFRSTTDRIHDGGPIIL